METARRAFTVRVEGRVQRLGFRRFIQETAQELGVEGRVKNEPDGSVTLFAQGDKEGLMEFLARISAAPSPIAIRRFEETPFNLTLNSVTSRSCMGY